MKSIKRQGKGSQEATSSKKKPKLEPWEEVFGPRHDIFRQPKAKPENAEVKSEERQVNDEVLIKEFFKSVRNKLKVRSGVDKRKDEALAKAILDEAAEKSAIFSSHPDVIHLTRVIPLASSQDLLNLMKSVTSDLQLACTQQHASNLTLTLLSRVLEEYPVLIQTLNEKTGEDLKQAERVKREYEDWLLVLSNYLLGNFEELITDWCAGHLYRMVFQILSGFTINNRVTGNRSRQNLATWIMSSDAVDEVSKVYDIPASFGEMFGKFFQRILSQEKMTDLIFSPESMPAMLTLILIVHQRSKDEFKQLVEAVFAFTRPERDLPIVDNIPNEEGTFVLQKTLLLCDDKQFSRLWKKHFRGQLECLVLHPTASFLVQHILESCRTSEQLEEMFSELCPMMEGITGSGRYDVIAKMAEACNRLTSCQDEFETALKNTLHIEENGEEILVPLVVSQMHRELFWMVHEYKGPYRGEYDQLLCGKRMKNPLEIKKWGSSILKHMVQFQKPKRIVKSALSLDKKMLEEMARHTFGHEFLEACFVSPTVSKKLKQKLIFRMKDKYHILAKHELSNRILKTMWNHSSLRLRRIVCEELSANENVKSSITGNDIFRLFGVNEFIKFRGKWDKAQMATAVKDKLSIEEEGEEDAGNDED